MTDASTPLEKEQAKTIQSRVLNVLKTWIKNYWMDFDSPEMIELLNRFVGEKLAHAEEHAEAAKWLGELIVKQQKEWRDRQIPLLSMRFELPPNVQLDALVDRIINRTFPLFKMTIFTHNLRIEKSRNSSGGICRTADVDAVRVVSGYPAVRVPGQGLEEGIAEPGPSKPRQDDREFQ